MTQKYEVDDGCKLAPYFLAPNDVPSPLSFKKSREQSEKLSMEARVWEGNVLKGWGLPNEATLGVKAFK